PEGANRTDKDLIAEFGECFTDAVRTRLMSDVPLGVFLSGGIDSASIAAVMSRLVDEPIKTFSVGFAEQEANELAYARTVAAAYRTDHHEVVVSPDEFRDALPSLIWHEDRPLSHAGSVPLYFVARLATDHVKVVLTGEGSDELLAGYERYAKTLYNVHLGDRYHRVVPASVRRAVRGAVEHLGVGSLARRKLERTFLCIPPDLPSIYCDNFAVFPRALQARLPARLKLQRATTKRILRESMKGVLPPSILTRPKVGFPVPVGSWFRGRWRGMVTELVLGERARRRGIFNPDVVRRLVGEHVS